jgi:hypothetical protein
MSHHALPRLRFSPVGESLSFAWPKESNQRKGHPWCVGLQLPCDARHPRRGWNSPWQGTQNVPCCGAQTPSLFSPRTTALLGDTQGEPMRALALGDQVALRDDSAGGCSPSALPIWHAQAGKKWNRVRVPQHGAVCAPCQGELVERPPVRAKSGTSRAAMWGRLSLVTFFGEAKKVTRPKAKQNACIPQANCKASDFTWRPS